MFVDLTFKGKNYPKMVIRNILKHSKTFLIEKKDNYQKPLA